VKWVHNKDVCFNVPSLAIDVENLGLLDTAKQSFPSQVRFNGGV
jgi:hypothetical protein